MNGMYGMNWGMGFGWTIGFITLVVVIWLVVKVVNQNNNQKQPKEKSALDILKERYARGELSKQEFEEKKKDVV